MLIVGGSQGARGINDAVMEIYTGIVATGLQVLWQTGERDYQRVEAFLHTGHLRESVRLFKFIEKMEYAYAAAHLALCRSGASTLAELMCTGTPAILIPLPTAAADHQTENAKAMAEAGAAIVWKEGDDRGKLLAAIVDLVNTPSRLHEMAGKARALGKPGASAELADAVVRLAERRHGR
jgi:UDP-N-acetylglucosamine--N-acetylmuramyl-(pentapeptide) pyrophosphoryl-undecaprenol N-acetylglucosamine transferase